jgi:non-specific serine/threonine protein kinase
VLKEKISKEFLKKLAGEENYRLGRNYFLADRVRIIKFTDDDIHARVFDESIYFVQLQGLAHRERVRFSCDCGSTGKKLCKHKVAVGLAVQARLAPMRIVVSKLDQQIARRRDKEAALGRVQQKLARANLAEKPKRANVRRLRPWEGFVDKIVDRQENGSTQWMPVFYLETRPGHWILHAKKVRFRKDGEYGKVSNLSEEDLENGSFSVNANEKFAVSYISAKADNNTPRSYYSVKSVAKSGHFKPGTESGHLFDLLRESKIFLDRTFSTFAKPVRMSPEKGCVQFRAEIRGSNVTCRPYLLWAGVEEPISEQHYFLTANPIWLLRENTLIALESPTDPAPMIPFQDKSFSLVIPKNQLADFLQNIEGNKDFSRHLALSEKLNVKDFQHEVAPRLYLDERAGTLVIELRFGYGEHEFTGTAKSGFGYKASKDKKGVIRVARDVEQENTFEKLLLDSGVTPAGNGLFSTRPEETVEWLLDETTALVEAGFELFGADTIEKFKVRRGAPTVKLEVKSEIDWFDLKLGVDFDGILVSIKELRKALASGKPYILLSDGSTARIPDHWLQKFQHLLQLGEAKKDEIKLSRTHATMIEALAEEADAMQGDPDYNDFIKRLNNFSGIKETPVPKSLKGTLRPYQQTGYDWLLFLQEYRFGGFLADDMGLGKTIQTLALLLHEKEKRIKKPSLIVSPKSVIFNWEQEIQKFSPNLRALRHEGLERDRDTEAFGKYDVILTTYGIMRRDIDFLKSRLFHYVILDESQNIKNPTSQTAKATRVLQASHRLVLTGTPIENNTIELWSQMAFLNPGMLGSQRYFQSAFATPIEKKNDESVGLFLQKLIFPFILRRKKEQVEKDLPPKTESIFYAEMLPEQEKLYNYWRDYYCAAILNAIETNGLAKSRIAVLEGLMKLRQIACHPQMIDPEEDKSSGKYEAFVEQLEEILSEGHKILVFSQFVKMLTILRKHIDAEKIPYEYLDGSTQNRQECVNNFQKNEDIKLFLISLRAGGTGLNLTAADYVIHYDPWWNPAVELQATDRTHRIGQDKHVFVYKFITKGTVEEKVLELQRRKQALADNLISTDRAFFKQLTKDDIQVLFG